VKLLGVVLAFVLTLCVAWTTPAIEQRHDGFGGRDVPRELTPPVEERSCNALGTCVFQGYAKDEQGRLFDVWLCDPSGALVVWPSACVNDPLNPCEGT
jgi:hypothetical protein